MTKLATRILLATDGSAEAARAHDMALFVAKTCRADLDILTVLEAPPGMDTDYQINRLYLDQLQKEAGQVLDRLVREAGGYGIRARASIRHGVPVQQITEMARELKSDLVVMGTRGRTGLAHVLLGSTAKGVVRGAPCPVLTVRSVPAGSSAPPVQVAHILVAVDFSDCSLEALEHTVQAAKEFGASVTILHVVEPASYGLDFALVCAGEAERTRASIEERLDQLAQVFREQGLAAEARLQRGVPAEEIVAFARKSGVDLIVMGTHGRRGFSHLVSGSVAEAVLRQAFCPVVTVKSPRYRPGRTRTMLPGAERACG